MKTMKIPVIGRDILWIVVLCQQCAIILLCFYAFSGGPTEKVALDVSKAGSNFITAIKEV